MHGFWSLAEPAQALASPFTGVLGDKCNRIGIIAAGTLLWGIMTAAIGLSTTLPQVQSQAVNGIGGTAHLAMSLIHTVLALGSESSPLPSLPCFSALMSQSCSQAGNWEWRDRHRLLSGNA